MALTRVTDNVIGNADGHLNLSGIITASSLSGSLVPSGDVNVGSNIKLGAASGIITATSFSGDGSNLTSLPAGLGTALSSTQTSPLNKLYYTNEILSIGATVTVDHPATGTGAYTQYADIRLEEGADLIIEDGDDVIPDILGLGTDGGGLGAGGSGRIRVDSITNKNANGAPNFPNGLTGTAGTFSGAISAASGTITGNLGVGGVLTYEDVTNVDSVGVITARSGIRIGATGANTLITGNADGIGIKTAAPSSFAFEIASPFNDIGRMFGPNSGNLTFRNGVANEVVLHTGTSDALIFGTNGNNERIRIGTAGQIGIAGANYGSSGQVLTSQGASSAVAWASLAVGKFASYAVVADANNQGNQNGGTFTSGAWRTRILDSEITDEDNIVSLSSNQFTLGAGNYFIIAWASALDVDGHQARLRDITNGATRAHGSSEYTSNSDYVTTKSWIFTRITPSSSTAYELQHRCQTTATNGFGNGSGDQWTQESNGDTYCMVIILKEV